MKRILLDYLACPDCGGDIKGEFEEELEFGSIVCQGCSREFEVSYGVPNLLSESVDPISSRVASEFAQEWKAYSEQRPQYKKQFLDWISPVNEEFFKDQIVLDGGCGKGRHLVVAAQMGAELVVGVDLGESAYVAREATRSLSNVEVVRGDLLRLPFKDGAFSYAYSVGVLHHLKDPQGGFKSVLSKVKSGGSISAWVYGYENNEWIVKFISPIRENFTNRLPHHLLKLLSRLIALVVVLMAKGVYAPWSRYCSSYRLFYQDYLCYIASFPYREIESIVYDQLRPTIACYLTKAEFSSWFDDLTQVVIGWHNQNSWRGFARKK